MGEPTPSEREEKGSSANRRATFVKAVVLGSMLAWPFLFLLAKVLTSGFDFYIGIPAAAAVSGRVFRLQGWRANVRLTLVVAVVWFASFVVVIIVSIMIWGYHGTILE